MRLLTWAQRQYFKENMKMMDMKEWLIALGSHISDNDFQTDCKGHTEPSLYPCLLFLNWTTHTHRHKSISISLFLRFQYPLFTLKTLRKNIDCVSGEMLLWFSLSGWPGEKLGQTNMTGGGRRGGGQVLGSGICQRMSEGTSKCIVEVQSHETDWDKRK